VNVLLCVVGMVVGVTQLHDVVYVLCERSSTIHRYNATTHERLTGINIKGLRQPRDIATCQQTSQLYVTDGGMEEACVWRVSSDSEDIKRCWTQSTSDKFSPWTLSVTSSRVLMTSHGARELMQLDAGGNELRQVQLPDDMMDPWHAVESPTGTFIVGHYNTQLQQWQVSEVNTEGRVLRQFSPGPSLRLPEYIAVDSQGNIFVADYRNRHILLLDVQLALRRIIIHEYQLNEKQPDRLCYNEQTGQLMVGLSGRPGSVAVFAVV